MKAYLSAVRDDDQTVQYVPVEEPVGIYRVSKDDPTIRAQTGDRDVDLGFKDTTVSKMREFGAPIQIIPEDDGIIVRNEDNANPITIDGFRFNKKLNKGEKTKLEDDALIELGYTTRIVVTIESDHEGEGPIGEVDGISVPAYIASLCDHLRRASNVSESVSETRKRSRELLDVLEDYPVDNAGYEAAKNDLERNLSGLRSTDGDIGEDRKERFDRVASRIQRIYER